MKTSVGLMVVVCAVLGGSCGDSTEADELGVGAECAVPEDCDMDLGLVCLPFRGGYCGLTPCAGDVDCPAASACIAHDDGVNYCFRICVDKPECNVNRTLENESNCSSSVTFVDGTMGRKACVPPSSSP